MARLRQCRTAHDIYECVKSLGYTIKNFDGNEITVDIGHRFVYVTIDSLLYVVNVH